jgi:hypothetical protein
VWQFHVNGKRNNKTQGIRININHHTEVPRYRETTGDIDIINEYGNLCITITEN